MKKDIQNKELMLEQIINSIGDTITQTDAQGNILFASSRWKDTVGYSPEEVMGKNVLDFIHPEDLDRVKKAMQTAMEGTLRSVEYRFRHKNGEYLWCEARGNSIVDEEGNFVAAIFGASLIDERKKLEEQLQIQNEELQMQNEELLVANEELIRTNEALNNTTEKLRQSEEKFRVLFESFNHPITIYDSNANFLMINSAGAKNFNLQPKDLIGKSLQNFIPEKYEEALERIEQVLDTETELWVEDYLDLPVGKKWFWSIFQPLPKKSGWEEAVQVISYDITEKKRAEKKLRLTKFSVDQASISIFWITPEGKFIYVNQAACKKLGYSRTELLNMGVEDVDPNFPIEARKEHWEKFKKIKTLSFETLHRRKNGETFPVQMQNQYLKFEGKEYEFAFAIDITKRKKAEEKRLESIEELAMLSDLGFALNKSKNLEKIYELIGKTVYQLNDKNAYVLVTAADKNYETIRIRNYFGFNQTLDSILKIIGQDPRKMVFNCKDLTQEEQEIFKSGKLEIVPQGLYAISTRKIPEKICNAIEKLLNIDKIYATGFTFGNVPVGGAIIMLPKEQELQHRQTIETIINQASIVIHRKWTEETLIESEKKFRRIVENSPYGIVLIDEKGMVIEWNSAYEKISGLSRVETLGKPMWEVQDKMSLIPNISEIDEERIKRIKKFIETGVHPWLNKKYEARIRKQDGQIRTIQSKIFAIPSEGKFHGCSIVEDITERKMAEEELKLTTQSLREANAAKNTFFSLIAHDLRNPLMVLVGTSEILLRYFPTLTKEELKKFIQNMSNTANNLYNSLENLLQWSKSQTEKINLLAEKFDVHLLIEKNISHLQKRAEEKGLKLYSETKEDIFVYADIDMTSTVFRNLISNAIQFTEEGEVKISAKEKGDFVEISVKDTGVGIPEEKMDTLFKLEITHQKEFEEGKIGLGLILCKEFVEKQGGGIWAKSQLGKGSTITFALPKNEEKQEKILS